MTVLAFWRLVVALEQPTLRSRAAAEHLEGNSGRILRLFLDLMMMFLLRRVADGDMFLLSILLLSHQAIPLACCNRGVLYLR